LVNLDISLFFICPKKQKKNKKNEVKSYESSHSNLPGFADGKKRILFPTLKQRRRNKKKNALQAFQ
jgi:hypothetical protein